MVILCTCSVDVACELPHPFIVSDTYEFVLELHSMFNISCTGKKDVIWEEPLPVNTHVLPGYYMTTLLIDGAEAHHTREYMCVYQSPDIEQANTEDIASIYIFVPGKY